MQNFYNKIKKISEIPYFRCSLFLFTAYIISLYFKNIPFLSYFKYVLGPTIALLYPGLFIAYFFPFRSATIVKRFVLSISISILSQPAFAYTLDKYFGVSINSTNLLSLNLLFFFIFFVSLLYTSTNKLRNENKPTEKKEFSLLLSGYVFICLIYIIHIHTTPFIPFGDPYTFKSITDYIIQNGHYPNGFIPATFPAYFWNYEPFYQLYLTVITILGGFSSFAAYKYIGMLIANLAIFPLYLILKKLIGKNINIKRIIALLTLSLLSAPILFLETETIRPQTIIFYFFPVVLLLLLESMEFPFLFFVTALLIALLSKFHIFYVILIPIFLFTILLYIFKSLQTLSRRDKSKTILRLAIPTLALAISSMFLLAKFNPRLQWVFSLFNTDHLTLNFPNIFFLTALPYNLGVFVILSPFLFFYFIYGGKVSVVRSSIYIFIFIIVEFLVLVEILPIISLESDSGRFFPFFGIFLIIPSVYGLYCLYEQRKHIRYVYFFTAFMFAASFFLTYNILRLGYDSWLTTSEFISLKKASTTMHPNSITITQGNNTPLIRSVFNNSLFIYQLTNTENKLIFFGESEEDRIAELNELCDFSFSGKLQQLNNIEKSYDDLKNYLEKSNNQEHQKEIYKEFWKLVKKENQVLSDTPFLTTTKKENAENKISTNTAIKQLAEEETYEKLTDYTKNLLHRSNDRQFSSLYIIYSKEKDKSPNNIAPWWREASFEGANTDFFNANKENFDAIYSDNFLDVWEFKGCKS